MQGSGVKRRARRALERQLEYQRQKAAALSGREAELMARMAEHSTAVRDKLAAVRAIASDVRVLEVGSGAHGLIFFFEGAERVGVDPLADEYRTLFPAWQERARTVAAFGEQLPFDNSSFDIVLCDNVVDHAENPRKIVEEIARVLAPGGMLYFTVNVHHPVYYWAATLHAGWRAVGVPFEITPFADHTVHLTLDAAQQLLAGLPLEILGQSDDIEQTRNKGRAGPRRHAGDRLKRWFFKNARWEAIAVKEDKLARSATAP
jgi:SAM-dependent methyltransferase